MRLRPSSHFVHELLEICRNKRQGGVHLASSPTWKRRSCARLATFSQAAGGALHLRHSEREAPCARFGACCSGVDAGGLSGF